MTDTEKLAVLKMDLQLLTNTQDDYLRFLLEAAAASMQREGIAAEDSADYNAAQTEYAAWIYRKRAAGTGGAGGFAPDGGETAMPRFLRRHLNNILMAQKAGAS